MGVKRTKGRGVEHDEVKKQTNLSLTPTAVEGLDAIAKERGISRSELVEQIGRGIIPLAEQATYQNGREAQQHIYISARSSQKCSLDMASEPQALHLSQWERLPESQGYYIIYVKDGNDRRSYKPCSFNISNMKKQFMADVQTQPELQQWINSRKRAYLLWSECNTKELLPEIREKLIKYHQKLEDDHRFRDTELPRPNIDYPVKDVEEENVEEEEKEEEYDDDYDDDYRFLRKRIIDL
jgi:hypothetical protein